jgi:hypothetical protein
MAVNLYAHQLTALEKMHNGTILKGGVGTGKSITAAAYFYTKVCGGDLRVNGFGGLGDMQKPRDVYVITTARKRKDLDWEKEFVAFGISTDFNSSVHGIQLTVDSWNNIAKYEEVENAFFIFDEQRLVGNGAWVQAFYKIARSNPWIMLSATPGDNWLDYIPVFVANGFYKKRTEFLRTHVVYKNFSKFPQVSHYVETGRLEGLRRQVLVEMPYERHTTRHIENVMVDHDKVLFDKVYKERWNIYEDRPIRDISELFRVMRRLVNSDPSRKETVRKLLEKHPRLIVFYNFNYELDELRKLGESLGVPCTEWNGQKHEDVPEGDRWIYLVQYTAGAEGWNCITTDAMVFFSLNYSYKINHQSKGRIDRLNTPYNDLYYYILRSNSVIDNAILRSLATKTSFNEKEFFNVKAHYARAA